MSDLTKENINLVYVLDELDKIDDEKEIDAILTSLKPIMLSNKASFIIVSGQKVFYKFANSTTIDDSLISSIISRNVHIPLQNKADFYDIFRRIINYEVDNNIQSYIDSLILRSNRIIRTFINLLIQDMFWEDNKAYLLIKEEDSEIYLTDSKILSILVKIETDDINIMNFSDGIRDFFIIQLYIWIQRIKLKGKTPFTIEEIYDLSKDYSQNYPIWCFSQLGGIFNKLIDCMVKERLLMRSNIEIEGNLVERYMLTESAKIKIENSIDSSDKTNYQFLIDMVELEKFSRMVFTDIKTGNEKKSIMPLKDLLLYLSRFFSDLEIPDNINKMIQAMNIIRHGNENNDIFNNEEIFQYDIYARKIENSLIRNYIGYVIQNYYTRGEYYKIEYQPDNYLDFAVQSKDLLILFVIKHKVQKYSDIKQSLQEISLYIRNRRTSDMSKVITVKLAIFLSAVNDDIYSEIVNRFRIGEKKSSSFVINLGETYNSSLIMKYLENIDHTNPNNEINP